VFTTTLYRTRPVIHTNDDSNSVCIERQFGSSLGACNAQHASNNVMNTFIASSKSLVRSNMVRLLRDDNKAKTVEQRNNANAIAGNVSGRLAMAALTGPDC